MLKIQMNATNSTNSNVKRKAELVSIVSVFVIFLMGIYPRFSVANTPFDFNYTVDGKVKLLNVFNDGQDTYLQALNSHNLIVKNVKMTQRGAYFVVPGLPTVIDGVANGEVFKVVWRGERKTLLGADDEHGFASAWRTEDSKWERIFFKNRIPENFVVHPISQQALTLKQVLRYLLPKSWTAYADAEVMVDRDINFAWDTTMTWLDVLDQVLEQQGLFAELNVEKSSLSLSPNPFRGAIHFHHLTPSHLDKNREATIDRLSSINLLKLFDLKSIVATSEGILIQRLDSEKTFKVIDPHTQNEIIGQSISWDANVYPKNARLFLHHLNGPKLEIQTILHPRVYFDESNSLGLVEAQMMENSWYLRFKRELTSLIVYDRYLRPIDGKWEGNLFSFKCDADLLKLFSDDQFLSIKFVNDEQLIWKLVS